MTFSKLKYKILDFIDNWIYPAYKIKNIFWNKFDIVNMKKLSRLEYYDINERMFHANMQLIVDFIEKEKPEKYIQWYGELGHKYGEHFYDKNPLLPKYKGQYIMDLIKLIYKFYKEDLPTFKNDYNYLTKIWFDFIYEQNNKKNILDKNTLNQLNKDIILKYLPSLDSINEDNKLLIVLSTLENNILEQKQEMLHLCIEVREYLWT